jgi:hypothetical protein
LVIFAQAGGSSRYSSRNRAGAEVVQQAYSLLLDLLTGDEEPRGATAAEFRWNPV